MAIPNYLKIGRGKSGYTPQLTNIWELDLNDSEIEGILTIDGKSNLKQIYSKYLNTIQSKQANVAIDDMSSGSQQNGGLVSQIKSNNVSDVLSLLVNNISIPQITMQDSTTQIPIIQLKTQSGRYTYSQVTMKFNEYIYLPVTTFFLLWIYKCVFDPYTGKYGLVQNYKLPQMTVKLEQNDDPTKSVMKWNLYGIYPQQVDNGQLNYTSVDNINTSITLNMDYMEMERMNS